MVNQCPEGARTRARTGSSLWRILPERDVAQRLLGGLARKAIAAELRISQHTVNDHVKAVFDKTGVSSAGQLRAMLFHAHPTRPRDSRGHVKDPGTSAGRASRLPAT